MRRALELSLKGRGCVHPNPLVGAVLVQSDRILSEGFHARFGGPHAEVEALQPFRVAPIGATLYVTLEPCAHTGKTPPCVDLILAKKIRHVVVATRDVSPQVSGRGIAKLRRAGVRVDCGVLADEAAFVNRDFNHWIRRRTPYVTVKAGQSLDGAIATASGQSKWITSASSRRRVMDIRAHADAILVGVNTVLRDNPRLTVRVPDFKGLGPRAIVLDPHLRTPRSAKIFKNARVGAGNTPLLVVSPKVTAVKRRAFEGAAEFLEIPMDRAGRLDLKKLLSVLGQRGMVQVLIEGGGETIGRAFDAGIVNEVHFFLAPTILGGVHAVRSVGGQGISKLAKAPRFKQIEIERLGNDLHYTGVF